MAKKRKRSRRIPPSAFGGPRLQDYIVNPDEDDELLAQTPPAWIAPDLPIWIDIEDEIPYWFIDDGPSLPGILRLLYGIVSIMGPRLVALLFRASRVHDWLYWFGRLKGAPLNTEILTRKQRDQIFRIMLERLGYPKIAGVAYRLVRVGGSRAYRNASLQMASLGDNSYKAYMLRKKIEGFA
jgi:hypothetical protein